jgi:pimeloyl-ACP methyl ester carboxylesterase
MPSIQTRDGVRLHYEVWGVGPLTLLFLHGWAGSAGYFDQLLEHLDLIAVRAVTLDLRGHGDSSQPESGYTDEQLAADALTVADAVGAKQFVAVGFSMSGRFVQYVPLLAPDRVFLRLAVSWRSPDRLKAPAKQCDPSWVGLMLNIDLRAGDEVEVIGGVLEGIRATVLEVDLRRGVVRVSPHLFCRPVDWPAVGIGEVLQARRKPAEQSAPADGGRDAGLLEFTVSARGRRC